MVKKLIPGRGSNPNSHGNNRVGDELTEKKLVSLLPRQWQAVKSSGGGNYSKGVRELINQALSADVKLQQAKQVIQLLLDNDPNAKQSAICFLNEFEPPQKNQH